MSEALAGLPEDESSFVLNWNLADSLPDGVFDNLPHLKDIQISGGLLKEIKKETFRSVFSLERLHLSNNMISQIANNSFVDNYRFEVTKEIEFEQKQNCAS